MILDASALGIQDLLSSTYAAIGMKALPQN
jgi:hypothetical protein